MRWQILGRSACQSSGLFPEMVGRPHYTESIDDRASGLYAKYSWSNRILHSLEILWCLLFRQIDSIWFQNCYGKYTYTTGGVFSTIKNSHIRLFGCKSLIVSAKRLSWYTESCCKTAAINLYTCTSFRSRPQRQQNVELVQTTLTSWNM